MSAGEQAYRARDSEVPANLRGILQRRWMVMAGIVLAALFVWVCHPRKAADSYAAPRSVPAQRRTPPRRAQQN